MWNELRYDSLAMECGTTTFTAKFLSGLLSITVILFLVSFSTQNWVTNVSDRPLYVQFGIWRTCFGNDSFETCQNSNDYLDADPYDGSWLAGVQAFMVLTLIITVLVLVLVFSYMCVAACSQSNAPVFIALNAAFVCVIFTVLSTLIVGVNQSRHGNEGNLGQCRLDWSFVLCCLCSFFYALSFVLLLMELHGRTQTFGHERRVARLQRQFETTFSSSRNAPHTNGHVPTIQRETPTNLFQANGSATRGAHSSEDTTKSKDTKAQFAASNPTYGTNAEVDGAQNGRRADYGDNRSSVDETPAKNVYSMFQTSSAAQAAASNVPTEPPSTPPSSTPFAPLSDPPVLAPTLESQPPPPSSEVYSLFQAKSNNDQSTDLSQPAARGGPLGSLPPLEPKVSKKHKKKKKRKQHSENDDPAENTEPSALVEEEHKELPQRPSQLQPDTIDSDEDF